MTDLNFSGEFTREQYDALLVWVTARADELTARRVTIMLQITAMGTMMVEHDNTKPTRVFAAPSGSRLDQLMKAYVGLGGDVLDLYVRPFYKAHVPRGFVDGDLETPAKVVFIDGTEKELVEYNTTTPAVRVRDLTDWSLPALKARRVRIESKVLQAVDYTDNLTRELAVINKLLGMDGDEKSLDALKRRLQSIVENDKYPVSGS